ncbi:MAG: zinc metalloprotease HtpX, partial [Kiloniellales bacterium]
MQLTALAPLNPDQQQRHKLRNFLHSLLLLGGMVVLLAACGWIVAGWLGVIMAILLGAIGLSLSPSVSPQFVLHLFGARKLPEYEMAEIYAVVAELSRRAGLERPPRLFYIASPTLNAFSVGSRGDAAIAMTSGLLSRLTLRELAGVLAHELSHIRNNDMWVMGLADMISRLTRSMSFVGVLLLVLNAPLLLAGVEQVPWLLVLLLIFAPSIGTLLQLALSRTREFEADLDGAGLTRDPAGLAAALQKLERYQGRFWEDIFLPGRRAPDPSDSHDSSPGSD